MCYLVCVGLTLCPGTPWTASAPLKGGSAVSPEPLLACKGKGKGKGKGGREAVKVGKPGGQDKWEQHKCNMVQGEHLSSGGAVLICFKDLLL